MTSAQSLATLLRQERDAIMARDWEKIGEFAEKKSAAMESLEAPLGADVAASIQRQAKENERLLAVMHLAASSLGSRLASLGDRIASVGYEEDGSRLSLSAQDQLRRV